MREWFRACVRRWLGVDALAGQLYELKTDVARRHLDVRAEFHRETTAIAQDLIAMRPTTTKAEPIHYDGDPHLGRN